MLLDLSEHIGRNCVDISEKCGKKRTETTATRLEI